MFNNFLIGRATYDSFSLKTPSYAEIDLVELNRKVLNYLNLEEYAYITEAEKYSFINYLAFVQNSYFSKEEALETDDLNNVIFRHEQWTLLRKYSQIAQNFIINNLFAEFNNGIKNYFNMSFIKISSDINIYQSYLNKIYSENKISETIPFMKKVDATSFSANLKKKIENIEKNIDNKLKYVSFANTNNNNCLYFEEVF